MHKKEKRAPFSLSLSLLLFPSRLWINYLKKKYFDFVYAEKK